MSEMGSNCSEFKMFYTFPAFTLDYTDNIWQILQ